MYLKKSYKYKQKYFITKYFASAMLGNCPKNP